jgi:uncharacterized protein YfiM (DUF2279 family)
MTFDQPVPVSGKERTTRFSTSTPLEIRAAIQNCFFALPPGSSNVFGLSSMACELQIKSYERSQKLAKAGKELAETRAGSAEREEKVEALFSLLDPNTQAYIDRCRGKIEWKRLP